MLFNLWCHIITNTLHEMCDRIDFDTILLSILFVGAWFGFVRVWSCQFQESCDWMLILYDNQSMWWYDMRNGHHHAPCSVFEFVNFRFSGLSENQDTSLWKSRLCWNYFANTLESWCAIITYTCDDISWEIRVITVIVACFVFLDFSIKVRPGWYLGLE